MRFTVRGGVGRSRGCGIHRLESPASAAASRCIGALRAPDRAGCRRIVDHVRFRSRVAGRGEHTPRTSRRHPRARPLRVGRPAPRRGRRRSTTTRIPACLAPNTDSASASAPARSTSITRSYASCSFVELLGACLLSSRRSVVLAPSGGRIVDPVALVVEGYDPRLVPRSVRPPLDRNRTRESAHRIEQIADGARCARELFDGSLGGLVDSADGGRPHAAAEVGRCVVARCVNGPSPCSPDPRRSRRAGRRGEPFISPSPAPRATCARPRAVWSEHPRARRPLGIIPDRRGERLTEANLLGGVGAAGRSGLMSATADR